MTQWFGNPASRSHAYGWAADEAVELAREQVASLVNADPLEIVWTSGATESDNLALKGAARFYRSRGNRLVTLATEHEAVLHTMRELEREVESSRAVYDAFLKRARETGELGGIDTTNARIISPAMPPLEKSGVSRRTIALLGIFAGAAIGALLALALALFAAPRAAESEAAARPARRSLWRRKPRPVEPEVVAEASPPSPPPPSQSPPQPAVQAPMALPAPGPPAPPEPPAVAARPAAPPAAAADPAPVTSDRIAGWRRLVALPGGQAKTPSSEAATGPREEPVADQKPRIVPRAAETPKVSDKTSEKPVPLALSLLGRIPAVRNRRWRREIETPRSVFQGGAHLVDVIDKPLTLEKGAAPAWSDAEIDDVIAFLETLTDKDVLPAPLVDHRAEAGNDHPQ